MSVGGIQPDAKEWTWVLDLAAAFDRVGGDQRSRPGRRSDGAAFTIETFARYLIHHLWDVRSPVG